MHMFKTKSKDVGWKFPVRPDLTTGRIKTSAYKDDVAESIKIILMTKKGERMMNPNFGCNINKFMFGILDITTLRQIELEVIEALNQWEHRIDNLEVQVVESKECKGQVLVNVKYTLLNSRDIISQEYMYDTE